MTNWEQASDKRWVRRDGAVVKYDMSSPYPNPALGKSHMWSAWEPDPSEQYLGYTRKDSSFYIMRRSKTPQAAMKAVDREYPLKDD